MIVVYFFYVNAGDKRNVDDHSQNSLHETPRPPPNAGLFAEPTGAELSGGGPEEGVAVGSAGVWWGWGALRSGLGKLAGSTLTPSHRQLIG